MPVAGTVATVQPFGLKTAHPGLAGLIAVDDGTFLIYSGKELTLVPGGPRLRVGTACTADPDGPYARNMHLTQPVPFP
jgi:hypothetical protein